MRNRHGWSQGELARRMTDVDVPWQRSTVAKIEGGMRQVTADELVALAFVLGVPPMALLVPSRMMTEMRVTPNTALDNARVWEWMAGHAALLPPSQASLSTAEEIEGWRFYMQAGPDYVALAETCVPGLAEAIRFLASVQRIVTSESSFVGGSARAKTKLRAVRDRLSLIIDDMTAPVDDETGHGPGSEDWDRDPARLLARLVGRPLEELQDDDEDEAARAAAHHGIDELLREVVAAGGDEAAVQAVLLDLVSRMIATIAAQTSSSEVLG